MEEAINYFTIFGGLDIRVNTTLPIEDQIQDIILDDYKHLRNIIGDIATQDPLLQSILSGAAMGDSRTNSSFRRANVSFDNGMDCVEELCDLGAITINRSLHHLTNQKSDSEIAKKLTFTTPFLRFWFAFVSPIFKGIRDGEYTEFYKNFENKKLEFTNLIFEQLCHEFIKCSFDEDSIDQIGRYWDNEVEIDLVAKTYSGKIIVGSCRYTNSKIKKTELTKIKDDCEHIELKPDIIVLFSKKGFTNEVKSLKGDGFKLYTVKSLKALIS